MKLLNGKITLTDLISKDNKSSADKLLKTITKSTEKPKHSAWRSLSSGGGGNFEVWNFSEIPDSLKFFASIKISISNFYFLPMSYTLSIEGTLSNDTLIELENLDDEPCKNKIEKCRIEFWNYWKNSFHGVISDPKSMYYFSGTGIVDFYLKINNQNELIDANKNDRDVVKNIRQKPILRKYGANIGGLLSITELFSNKISIVSQGAAIFGFGGLDFSWITKFEFYTEENLFLNTNNELPSTFLRTDSLFQLLFIQLWLDHRISEIDKWKNKIAAFSKELEKLQMLGTKLKSSEMEMSPLSEKRAFLIDFTSILEENRFISRFLHEQQSRQDDEIGGEKVILGTMAAGMKNEGFLFNFYEGVSSRNNIIKEEYQILDNQYEILSGHLNQLLSLVNAKSSVQLSESNRNTQWVIIGASVITAIASIIILVLTGTLVSLNQELLAEGQDTSKLLATMDKTNNLMLASLYSNYELKVQYEIHSFERPEKIGGFMYDLQVTNYGDYDAQVNSTWYLNNELCDINGNHFYINRAHVMSDSVIKSDIIIKKGLAQYVLEIPRIYPNYTNLRPFTIEIVSEGTPVTPDKTPIHYFTKTKIARVQFVYDNITKDWIPEVGWDELNCSAKSNENHERFILDTMKMDQFKDIG